MVRSGMCARGGSCNSKRQASATSSRLEHGGCLFWRRWDRSLEHEFRIDGSGIDDRKPHSIDVLLKSSSRRERAEASFACRVCRAAHVGPTTCDAADQHHVALCRTQFVEPGVAEVETAAEVDGDEMVPRVRCDLREAPPGHVVSGGTYEDVETLKTLDKVLDGRLIRHIQLDRATTPDGMADGPGVVQPFNDRATDPASAARNHGDLACQRLTHPRKPSCGQLWFALHRDSTLYLRATGGRVIQ